MASESKAFEIKDDGLLFSEGAHLFSGNGSPVGLAASIGATYFRKDVAEIWQKYGPGDNDWIKQLNASFKNRYAYGFTMNGSVGNNEYIKMNELVTDAYFQMFFDSKVIGFRWRNTNTARNFDVVFSSGGGNPPGTTLYTYQARNKQYDMVNNLNLSLNEGQFLFMKVISQGALPSDLSGYVLFEEL